MIKRPKADLIEMLLMAYSRISKLEENIESKKSK